MKAADVMSRYVEFIGPDCTAQEAAEMMGELDLGGLPVGSERDLQGIVTDRDILYRVVARGLDPTRARLREVMSAPVVACAEDEPVQSVMDRMAAHHIRRMPVQDAAGRVSGWITLADLSRRLLLDSEMLQDGLRRLTEAPA